jgi:hypothetical protein
MAKRSAAEVAVHAIPFLDSVLGSSEVEVEKRAG